MQENLRGFEREDVFNLLALVDARKPRYTVSGYFMLNRTTLLAFLSTVTTYFIIVVQFSQNQNK